jgi:hypothetical protein
MRHVEFLVEEPSMEVALTALVPRLVADVATFRIHAFTGKRDLLRNLPHRLQAYARIRRSWPGLLIVVLVDRDDRDCITLKNDLERMSYEVGLRTRTHPGSSGEFDVINWLAIEELEAWFLGDVPAIKQAYPGVPETLADRARYRNPDAIRGGTWEALEEILQGAGHHKGGLSKIRAARDIAPLLNPAVNRSRSFCGFRDRLRCAVGWTDIA